MADAEKTLQLLIEMKQIGAEDVKAARALVDEMGQSTRVAGKATEDLGQKEHEASGHAEQLHLNHRALHQIMHLIGKETAPELGHALAGALYGPMGIALAVGYAFEAIREHIAETNKELDEMGKRAAEAFADIKANLFDAIKEETFSTEKVDKFFANLKAQADAAKVEIENAFALLREKNTAAGEINRAKEEAELSRARERYEASVKPGDSEGNREKKKEYNSEVEAIKAKWAAINAALKMQMEQDVADEAKALWKKASEEMVNAAKNKAKFESESYTPDQREQIDRMIGGLKDKGPEGEMKKRFLEEKSAGTLDYSKVIDFFQGETHKQTIEKVKKDLGDQNAGDIAENKKLHAARDQDISDLSGDGWKSRWAFLPHLAKMLGDASLLTPENSDRFSNDPEFRKKIADRLQEDVSKSDAKIKAEEDYLKSEEIAAAIVKQRAETEKKYADELAAAIDKLAKARVAMDQSQSVADVKKDATEKSDLFKNQSSIIERGIAAEDAVQRTGRATADQVAAIKQLNELAHASGTNMAAILNILKISHAMHNTQAGDIETIKRQFDALSARVNNSRNIYR